MKWLRRTVFGGVVLGLVAVGVPGQKTVRPTSADQTQLPGTQQDGSYSAATQSGRHSPEDEDTDVRRSLEQKRMNMVNVERQKNMVREATQLVQIAAELRLKIQQGKPSDASPEEFRQAETIEKLSHSIRDRMRGSR